MAHWHGNGEWFCLRCNQSVKKANLLVHSCYQGGFNIRCFSCRQLIGSSERVAELHLKEFHGQENTSLDALYGEKCPKCARRYKALAIHMGKTHPCSEYVFLQHTRGVYMRVYVILLDVKCVLCFIYALFL